MKGWPGKHVLLTAAQFNSLSIFYVSNETITKDSRSVANTQKHLSNTLSLEAGNRQSSRRSCYSSLLVNHHFQELSSWHRHDKDVMFFIWEGRKRGNRRIKEWQESQSDFSDGKKLKNVSYSGCDADGQLQSRWLPLQVFYSRNHHHRQSHSLGNNDTTCIVRNEASQIREPRVVLDDQISRLLSKRNRQRCYRANFLLLTPASLALTTNSNSPNFVSKVPLCNHRNFRVNLGPISLNATRVFLSPGLNSYLVRIQN